MSLGKDWTLMLQSYLILLLEEFKGFQIRIITVHCVCAICWISNSILKLQNVLNMCT